jgi:hypothetical protein
MADYFSDATQLQVIKMYEPNITGWRTPRELYDPALGHAPTKLETENYFDHGTVGENTLRFWCTRQSIISGAYTMAKYLIPHDTTVFADNKVHDTRHMIFKMHADNFCCNHAGPCIGPFNNRNSIGTEYESLQNGRHDISDNAYINGALCYTYEAVVSTIRDYRRVPHGLVAIPWGRRSDPWAGLFDIARSWEITQAIRQDSRIWNFWGLRQPSRGL